jgi:ubiquinol-cytochrome c reductase cytochrome b subunit
MLRLFKYNILLNKINSNLYDSLTNYNINYFYNFGFLLGISMFIQYITGLLLSMFYIGTLTNCFYSIEYIMRECNLGYYFRFILSIGVSIVFMFLYILISRNLYYTSYTSPRTALFISGVLIFLLLIIIAFLGYSLVGGIQSY